MKKMNMGLSLFTVLSLIINLFLPVITYAEELSVDTLSEAPVNQIVLEKLTDTSLREVKTDDVTMSFDFVVQTYQEAD